MSIYGIQLSVIIIALITAYMGYQFNFRAKKRESFLKELSNSYIEVYFPMNELLKDIINKEDIAKKRELTHEFFERFKGPESKIKFIGSSFLLEYFYELENLYLIYNSDPNRTNESSFLNKLKSFSNKIEYEFWEAHDIIYEDHLKFKNLSNKNPLVIAVLELITGIYYLTTFSIWVSLIIIYFSIFNHFIHMDPIPLWWRLEYAIYIFLIVMMIYGFMQVLSTFAIKKNRRKNITFKRIKEKIFKKKLVKDLTQ